MLNYDCFIFYYVIYNIFLKNMKYLIKKNEIPFLRKMYYTYNAIFFQIKHMKLIYTSYINQIDFI